MGRHGECKARAAAGSSSEEHVPVQHRAGQADQCSLCSKPCKPGESVSYIKGVPRHSECAARAGIDVGKAVSPRRDPAKYAADNTCSLCGKVRWRKGFL